MKNALAWIAALLIIYSTIPYAIDVAKKKTKPNVVTWVTWTMLTGISTAATFAAHQDRTAILTLGSAISTGLVVVLGLRHGFAKYSLFDIICQAAAILGFALWLIFNSPSIAIIAAVAIDFIAMLPTLRHAWINPHEETLQTFLISSFAAGLTLVSLQSYNVASLTYPIYLFAADLLIAADIAYSRTRKKKLPPGKLPSTLFR